MLGLGYCVAYSNAAAHGRGISPPLSVREIYDTAESTYAPESLPDSDVVLVRARVGEGGDTPYRQIYTDETFGWNAVTNNIAVVDVEGGHSSMLQEPSSTAWPRR